VREHLNRVERGNALETEWNTLFARWSEAFPRAREEWDAAWDGRIGAWTLPEWEAV
jgi:transketolase